MKKVCVKKEETDSFTYEKFVEFANLFESCDSKRINRKEKELELMSFPDNMSVDYLIRFNQDRASLFTHGFWPLFVREYDNDLSDKIIDILITKNFHKNSLFPFLFFLSISKTTKDIRDKITKALDAHYFSDFFLSNPEMIFLVDFIKDIGFLKEDDSVNTD